MFEIYAWNFHYYNSYCNFGIRTYFKYNTLKSHLPQVALLQNAGFLQIKGAFIEITALI